MEFNETLTINIISFPQYPFVMDCFDSYPASCPMPGLELLLLLKIFEISDIAYNFTKVQNQEEMINILMKNESDITGQTEPLVGQILSEFLEPTSTIMEEIPTFICRKFFKSNLQRLLNEFIGIFFKWYHKNFCLIAGSPDRT